MNLNKTHATMTAMMAVHMLLPFPAQAQDTSRNYVKTVTMLDAGGTDSLQAVQYYNGLGWPTVSVATAGANGGTACTLTAYDVLLKAGIKEEELEKIKSNLKGIHWGFSTTPKPWTSEEQKNAVEKEKKKAIERNKRRDSLQMAL